jgi:hypothetical protein
MQDCSRPIGIVLCLALLLGTAPAVRAEAPISLHPENPHYFMWRGKPTVLVTSGEHYGAVLNLDFEYEKYLDELRAKGLNHTRTFSGVYREIGSSFGITDNPLAPEPHRYIGPWARSETPGYFDGGNKFDLTRWDKAYFHRLREFLAKASERGVVVELTLFCPMYNDDLWKACPMNAANNINDVGRVGREEVYTLKHDDLLQAQIAVTRKIVQEVSEFDNLYFEICNEPYFGGVSMDWQRKMADVIAETEKELPRRHLISMNIANGSQRVENPHPVVSIFNFHYCTPPDAVAMNYDLNRVIGENETGFRGRDDLLYRTEGWEFLLAGGALYNNLDYSFTTSHPDGSFLGYKSPGGGSPALREQLAILKQFLESFQFIKMAPEPTLVKSVSGGFAARALSEPEKQYAIYVHAPLPKKPENLESHRRRNASVTLELELPKGEYRAEWVSTMTGKIERSEPFAHGGGSKRLESPRFDDDIALRIRSQ